MAVCDLPGWVMKGTVASSLIFLGLFTLGKTSCHMMKTFRQIYGEIHMVRN